MKKIIGFSLGVMLTALAFAQSAGVFNKYAPAIGIQYNPGSTYIDTAATGAQIASPFGCSGSQGLSGTGGCLTPSGGTVTSFSVTSVPSWMTSSVATATTTPALTLGLATGQTANQFLATPNGTTGAVGLRAIVGADMAPVNLGSTANGGVLSTSILLGTNGGTSNGFFSVTGPTTSLKTFTFPNASANVLTDNAAVTVAQGGTGVATLPVHGVLLGEGTAAVSNVAAMAADTLLQGKGTTADPAAVSVNNCGSSTQALSYSTSTHTFGCQTISVGSSGTVTSISAGTGISASPNPITTTGTVSVDQTFSPTWTGAHVFTPSSAVVAETINAAASTRGVVINGGANAYSEDIIASSTSGQSLGLRVKGGTTSADQGLLVQNQAATATYLSVAGDGSGTFGPTATAGVQWTSGANVTVAGSSTGAPLTVSGGNTHEVVVSANHTAGHGLEFLDSNGTPQSFAMGLGLGTGAATWVLFDVTNNTGRLTLNSSGDFTFPAPSSGATVTITGPASNNALNVNGSSTTGSSQGLNISAGTNSSDYALWVLNQSAGTQFLKIFGDGHGFVGPTSSLGLSWATTGTMAITAPSSTTISVPSLLISAPTTASNSFGLRVLAGTNSSDEAFIVNNAANTVGLLQVFGDGGTVLGAATGGDKGAGTINVSGGIFINGVSIGGTTGFQLASVVGNCSSGGCTAVNAKGVSTTITRNSAGNYTVNFSPTFPAQPSCTVSNNGGTAGGIGTFTNGGTATGTVIMYVAAVATDMSFDMVCSG